MPDGLRHLYVAQLIPICIKRVCVGHSVIRFAHLRGEARCCVVSGNIVISAGCAIFSRKLRRCGSPGTTQSSSSWYYWILNACFLAKHASRQGSNSPIECGECPVAPCSGGTSFFQAMIKLFWLSDCIFGHAAEGSEICEVRLL